MKTKLKASNGENIAYIMAKHAEPDKVSDSPEEWLEEFNTFSIY